MSWFDRGAGCAAWLAAVAVLALSPPDAQGQTAPDAELKAQYEEAETYRRGIGVPRDLERALAMHARLVEQGYTDSYVRLASISARLGRHEDAIAAYEAAVEAGGGIYAQVRLAAGHAMGDFGELSRRDWGIQQLRSLAAGDDTPLIRYYLAQAIEERDGVTDEGIALYTTLAAEGYAAAQSRLGHIYLDGEGGVEARPERAVTYFRQAAENDNAFATLWLAEALIADGKGREAREAADRAVEAGVAIAETRRALWHIDGAFGAASDADFGKAELARLAAGGRTDAASAALKMHERRSTRIEALDLEAVIAKLEERAAAGDADAVAVLARAYVRLYWLIPDNGARHASLIAQYGDLLDPEQAIAERVQASYDPTAFSASLERIGALLAGADGPEFVSGLMRLRSIEIKAFVYTLQEQLNALDYGPCTVTGEMGQCSLEAVMRFCADEGLMESCTHGPMYYAASRDIVQALARKR